MSKIEISPSVTISYGLYLWILAGGMVLVGILGGFFGNMMVNNQQIDDIRNQFRLWAENQPTLEQRALLEFAVRDISWYGDDVKKSVIMCNSMNLHNITGDIAAFGAKCSRWFGGNIAKAQCECVTLNETVR